MKNTPEAFTRIELAATIAALALMAALALPLLATTRADSERAECLSNLRQFGRGAHLWAADHTGQLPWRTLVSRGGTQPDPGSPPKAGVTWFEFSTMSNDLATPRILACPADAGVRVASEFSTHNQRGYMSAGFRSQATSYFVNIHTLMEFPATVLIGDRNVAFQSVTSCSFGLNNVNSFITALTPGWTNAVHGLEGNLLKIDGSATTTTPEQFRQAFQATDDNGIEHLLKAR